MNQDQLIAELKKLGTLHDSGVLSDEEFNTMKDKLLTHLGKHETSEGNSESVINSSKENYNHDGEPIDQGESPNTKKNIHSSVISIKNEKANKEIEIKVKDKASRSLKSSLGSKGTIVILSIIIVLLCGIAFFFIFYKSTYEKALERIEEMRGEVLADVDNTSGHDLIFATTNGLYLWNLKNKEPQKLYSNLDSLTIRRFWSDFETFKIQESEEPASGYNEDGSVANIFSQSPQKLYRVVWPWIIIGKHYVANVNSPNKLFNISYSRTSPEFDGLLDLATVEDGGDWVPDSVYFNADGDFVINVYNNNHGLPGIDSYSPKFIETEAWRDNNYVDTDLLSKYGNLFPEYNRRYKIGIPIGIPYVTGRTIWIDKNNTIHRSQNVSWGKYTFNEKDMTPEGMAPIYQKVEQEFKDNLANNLSKKREELENIKEKIISKIKEEAITLYDFTNLYDTNRAKAIRTYPLNNTYILKVRIEAIESGSLLRQWVGKLYNYFHQATFYTSDDIFEELNYPCWVYLKANFVEYNPYAEAQMNSEEFVFDNAELICEE